MQDERVAAAIAAVPVRFVRTARHPAVSAVAVIGVPDAKYGEAIQAVVVLKPRMCATADEIVEHCRGLLSSFKKPRYVDFVDSLPVSGNGKLLKRVLRYAG